jgi:hypothetical protein
LVEFGNQLGAFLVERSVLVDFGNGGGVVEVLYFFDKGVVTTVLAGEEGKEPRGCHFSGGFSIVRTQEELDDICGLPRLPPSQ